MQPIKILFVCLGNICRSPMAEYVMREKIKQAHLQHKILTTHGTDLLDNPSIGPGVRQQLVRIIAELINNTAKYTPPSSTATLTIEADDNTLECMCTNPINPDRPTSTATSSQLGLIQARQRIESLGGSLHITHTNDRWTAIFTIPLQPISPMPTD